MNWGKDREDLRWCGREFQSDETEGTKEFKVEEVLQYGVRTFRGWYEREDLIGGGMHIYKDFRREIN